MRHEAKRLVLDTLGCLIAGVDCEIGSIASTMAAWFGVQPRATIAGTQARGSVLGAIYANARTANALDLDETFPVGAHFGSAGVVVALALAEELGLSGSEMLLATIAGYEFAGRVASYIGPVARRRRRQSCRLSRRVGCGRSRRHRGGRRDGKGPRIRASRIPTGRRIGGVECSAPDRGPMVRCRRPAELQVLRRAAGVPSPARLRPLAQQGSRGFTELLDGRPRPCPHVRRGQGRSQPAHGRSRSTLHARGYYLQAVAELPIYSLCPDRAGRSARPRNLLPSSSVREVVVETGPLGCVSSLHQPRACHLFESAVQLSAHDRDDAAQCAAGTGLVRS